MRGKILLAATVTLLASMCAMGVEFIGDEWVTVTNTPKFFNIPSPTNVFTVAFDAEVPNSEGTLFGFNLYKDNNNLQNVWVGRSSDGKLSWGYGSRTVLANGVDICEGPHHFVVGYDCYTLLEPRSIRGINIYLDGTKVYHSTAYSWSNNSVDFISVGGKAIANESHDVLRTLKVRNLRFWYGHRVGTLMSVY